jgi:alanine racemase
MDQLMIDVGGAEVHAGDEVVLLGRQGSVEIDAHEWADRLGTITNEVVTRIGHRLPRYYVGGRSPR